MIEQQRKVLYSLIDEMPEEYYAKIIDYLFYVKYTAEHKNETLYLSEKSLAKDWLSKEEDEAWASL